jgi:putative DNA modification/repair radical SAM protein
MELLDKLTILANGAKYDAACTSSGAQRPGNKGLGSTLSAGCCHSFAADGRCISLLKVLLTNHCIYDCKYCVNRCSRDIPRTAFTPEELAELTIQFYRRNYIEGLFLSSGVVKNPDHTMELMIRTLKLLRYRHDFWGYIHAKTIPGAAPGLIEQLGRLADRISVNIELPSENSLHQLAPDKTRQAILSPMRHIRETLAADRETALVKRPVSRLSYKKQPRFAAAGQATQMIIGASPETDFHILRLASGLYETYQLKRVFYSAYIPAVEDSLLPALNTTPPLLREHRLYQADWLLRQYQFSAEEILNEESPNFNPYLDPKCNWAIHNPARFPVDVNRAPLPELLRVPGIGPVSAKRIVAARRSQQLGREELKRLGVVLKRAQYFIVARERLVSGRLDSAAVLRALIDPKIYAGGVEQLVLFPDAGEQTLPGNKNIASITEAAEEAVTYLAQSL